MQFGGVVLVVRKTHGEALPEAAGLSLLFAAGTRPSAIDVERLFDAGGAVARISSRRGAQDGWLELLASGLTFDLHGLAEGEACPVPPASHYFGLPRLEADFQLEAITLIPGPHIGGGGAFPALGMCGVVRKPDGGVESQGLAFFVGHELRVEPRPGEPAAETVKLAVRMIDHLVRHGPIRAREALTGPGGEALLAEPVPGGRFVRLWRDA